MRGNNFVAFLTVQGFFLGLVVSILQAQTAADILTYTFLITAFFYLFSHLFVAFYYRTFEGRRGHFPKQQHESDLDYFVREIEKRELTIDKEYELSGVNNMISEAAKNSVAEAA